MEYVEIDTDMLGQSITLRVGFEYSPYMYGSNDCPPVEESFDIFELIYLDEDENGNELAHDISCMIEGLEESLIEELKNTKE